MLTRNIVQKSVLLLFGTLLLGCMESTPKKNLYPNINSLSQERVFLIDKPFVISEVQPTISFVPPSSSSEKRRNGAAILSALFEVVAPELIEGTVDLVGKSIIEMSGKNDEVTTIDATLSNFFYKDSTYNLAATKDPAFNVLFVSGEFGESSKTWEPKGLDSTQRDLFQTLHLVGKPNFYMEAKIFPVPGNQYMEIVPTYMFYNRTFNSKGFDSQRDLAIHFGFYNLNSQSDSNLFSDGNVILRDVQVGKEYTQKELAKVRTTFIKMPKIDEAKKGYSGGYNLKVSVTETRDINEWLASLGKTISGSKTKISSKLYVSDEEKIERDLTLKKAKIQVEIMQEKIKEAQLRGDSKAELLKLESQLLDKKADANKEAIRFGKSKLY